MICSIDLPNEASTMAIGERLSYALPDDTSGLLITLRGELGAGKTTLVRALLRASGHKGAVPSPSYTLVEPYDLKQGPFYHVDLYRIGDAEELEFLGWDDLREGLVLLEWPERAAELLADTDLAVSLEYQGRGRAARLEARSARAVDWLSRAGLANQVVK